MVKKKPINFDFNDKGCFICTSHRLNEHGYAVMTRNNKKTLIHRYVYKEMFGEIPVGMVIRHKCDTPTCINPEHLQMGTQHENVLDRVYRGRGTKGERVPMSILKEEQVREIKMLIGKMTNEQISRKYKISQTAVSNIRTGKTWKHVI